MNANIRRAAVSLTAAGALTLAGGGVAMADEASFEEQRSTESAYAGEGGAYVDSSESDTDAEAHSDEVNPYYDQDGYSDEYYDEGDDNEEDDGLLGLGIL
jgi:hypothetical protein